MTNDQTQGHEGVLLLKDHLLQGESRNIEFMAGIPLNVRDLAKEIAAFATSNHGVIYLGVSNDVKVVGLKGIESPKEKDEIQLRIEGICNMVQPTIKVKVDFLEIEEKKLLKLLFRKVKGMHTM